MSEISREDLQRYFRNGVTLPVIEETAKRESRWLHDKRLLDEESARRQARAWMRLDLAIVRIICKPGEMRTMLAKMYHFALAHGLGYVSRATHRYRLGRCNGCTFRTTHELPVLGRVAYCDGEGGGRGCGCMRHPLWPMASLTYKTSLAAWRCPAGKFHAEDFDGFQWATPWWGWIGYAVMAAMGGCGWMAWSWMTS